MDEFGVSGVFGDAELLAQAPATVASLSWVRRGKAFLDILFSWCMRECISCPGVQLCPGVQHAYVRGREVTDVSRDHRQAMH